jgi:hypothetical protein
MSGPEGVTKLETVYNKQDVIDHCYIAYRAIIVTQAAQVRYNIFHIQLPDSEIQECPKVVLRLAAESDNMDVTQVKQSVELNDIKTAIMIEIPPQVEPGDYQLDFLMYANGKYCAELPCIVRVIEPLPGFEISYGNKIQRGETYDDLFYTPGAGITYRGNYYFAGGIDKWECVDATKVVVEDNFNVSYRADITTQAGQVRYNIFSIMFPGGEVWGKYKVELRLADKPGDIAVTEVYRSTWLKESIALMIDIPENVKRGDYHVDFLIYINGIDYGKLPCVIHVIE